jgi:crotonobetainyl-CoA:carnitine CoA-transferase CaiB-like acyl-CoA transferase
MLNGLRVLEYARFAAAPYCAKLLADLGAEVIKIEDPGTGDFARKYGPFPRDIPHSEKSGLFLYLNTNKLGITLNMESSTGQSIFLKLIEHTDILIEDNTPSLMMRLGIYYKALKEVNPRLIMTSITPFGQNGPYAEYKANYLNTYHSGMLGYFTPVGSSKPEREPLRGGGLIGEYAAGLTAAVATLGALYWQKLKGSGQHVDVSKQEALIGFGRVSASSYANGGIMNTRIIRLKGKGGMMPCRDGHVCIHVPENRQWRGLMKLMGYPEWSTDEKYNTPGGRIMHWDEAVPHVEEWTGKNSREDVYHPAQKLGCPVTPVMTSEDVVNSQQSKSRGLFTDIRHPEAGSYKYPASPLLFSGTPGRNGNPAPLLGEHNDVIYVKRMGMDREEFTELMESGVI